MVNFKSLLKKLDNSSYSYKLFKHGALYTVEDSKNKRGEINGLHSKNLFLKNKKNKFFLFSCHESRKVDIKVLAKSLSIGNISFAKEDHLLKYLGVMPGSVTPFGLLNDKNREIKFYLDKDFILEKNINFHPLINTATINIKSQGFINFLIENNIKVNIFDFDTYSVMKDYNYE